MTVKTSERFLSLDVFRGLTIALMILVNTPGTGADLYPYLVHAQWFGFTLADLVFPSFLFAVGNAMSFSMRKFQEAAPADFWKKVLKLFFFRPTGGNPMVSCYHLPDNREL